MILRAKASEYGIKADTYEENATDYGKIISNGRYALYIGMILHAFHSHNRSTEKDKIREGLVRIQSDMVAAEWVPSKHLPTSVIASYRLGLRMKA